MTRAYRSGVHFDCDICGSLLKDDPNHGEEIPGGCVCESSIVLVGRGTALVQGAKWYRCSICRRLYMYRRGELVKATPRAGFDEFTNF